MVKSDIPPPPEQSAPPVGSCPGGKICELPNIELLAFTPAVFEMKSCCPGEFDTFPNTVPCVMSAVPSMRYMPPPAILELFAPTVALVKVEVPPEPWLYPPPFPAAELELIETFSRLTVVSVLLMPPPP